MSQVWDFIIVGAGSAGCVLANRLSSNPQHRVLLVEAGGSNRSPWIRIPIGYFRTIGNPRYDWCYETAPEPHLGGRCLSWPRGRGLGGSSAINGLIYVRGQPSDFDGWGLEGWRYEDVLPYFRRIENQERGADEWHGDDGPQAVADGRARFEITDRFYVAALAHGLRRNPDCNGADQAGAGYYQTTSRKGLRVSSAHAFLNPVRRRSNLRVLTECAVERVLIENNVAAGIRVSRAGSTEDFKCSSEVILAAGSIASPQLLLLSGVGDHEKLSSLGIATQHHSPEVGRNLQDHLKFHNAYRVSIPTLNTRLATLQGKLTMALEYLALRRGPLTMGAAPVFTFLHHSGQTQPPDIQFHVVPWSSDNPAQGFHSWPGFSVSICPIKPQSRGSIELVSADPHTPPKIVANYLATQQDRDAILGGLRQAQAICRRSPLIEVIEAETWPGPTLVDATDDEMLEAIKARVSTIFHPVGTVAMGSADNAPLDLVCRVRGVAGLRVVDASVMPRIVSGNANAAVQMIAEKVSDAIRHPDGSAWPMP